MSEEHGSRLKMLAESIRQTLIYKYLLLCFIILVAGFITNFDFATRTFKVSTVLETILSGTVATLMLSIIYDLFTKKQQEWQVLVDQERLLGELSREVFLSKGLQGLTDHDIAALAGILTNDDRFLNSLASLTSEKSGFAASVVDSFFRPLWRTSGFEFHAWENYLLPNEQEQTSYIWKSRQRFHPKPNRSSFRVAITDRSIIASKLMNQGGFDSVLVVSDAQIYGEGPEQEKNLQLKVGNHRHRGMISIPPLNIKEFEFNFLARDEMERVKLVEFCLPADTSKDAVLDFQFLLYLSFNDPYFFVQADDLCFVSEIIIDYKEIKSRMGQHWVVSFIGNSGTLVDHDVHANRVVAQIDGPLMPGQGVALIWKQV